jgi:hypothetical protein
VLPPPSVAGPSKQQQKIGEQSAFFVHGPWVMQFPCPSHVPSKQGLPMAKFWYLHAPFWQTPMK